MADTVLELCAAHPMYGPSRLWRYWIEDLRSRVAAQRGNGSGRAGLGELRRRCDLTQADVADRLGISQSDLSKLQRRTDLRLSSLRRYVEATGGELRVMAVYPDQTVVVEPGRGGAGRSG